MANPGDEFVPAHLPEEDHVDYFKVLIENCVKAFRITLNDSTALDANGVIGKMRVMVLDDPTYKKQTKIIKAQRVIDDLSELSNIQRTIEYEEDEDDEKSSDPYDIRNKDGTGEPRVKKPKKLFDKTQIDLKMKVFQAKRDLLAENRGEEDKEGDALNYFFIPITREEFERLKTVEISAGNESGADAYVSEDSAIAKVSGIVREGGEKKESLGSAGKYEEIDGELTLVAKS